MKKQITFLLTILLGLMLVVSPSSHVLEQQLKSTQAAAGDISIVAGGPGVDLPALSATLGFLQGIAVDASGNVYMYHDTHYNIYRYEPGSGNVVRVAGIGKLGFSGDGGQATGARLSNTIDDIALDSQGDLLIPDTGNNRIRKVDISTGIITTIAGTGTGGFSGDGGLATAAQLAGPIGIAVDSSDNIYFAEQGNRRVRRIDAGTGIITTVAGNGTFSPTNDGVDATTTALPGPIDVAVDSAGNLFISDSSSHAVRRVDNGTGLISTYAGTLGVSGNSGNGGLATSAQLDFPQGIVIDGSDHLFIAVASNRQIRRVDAGTGIITGVVGTTGQGYTGDGGPATSATLDNPRGVDVDASGNIYVADSGNYRLRRVDNGTGNIDTLAGNGFRTFSGEGQLATAVPINPSRIARDSAGNIHFTDPGSYVVWKIDQATGLLSVVVGTGLNSLPGSSGDGGPALSANLAGPAGITFDEDDNLFHSENNGSRVRRTDSGTGIITAFAGGVGGFSGDGGPAVGAGLSFPTGIAFDDDQNLYINDVTNARVRRVDASTGFIDTFAGTGSFGVSGDGGPANVAAIGQPSGISIDSAGNVFFGDFSNHRVRRVDAQTGIITTYAGSGTGGTPCILGPNDGGPATSACISQPFAIAHDSADNLYIFGAFRRLWKVDVETDVATIIAGEASQPASVDPASETLDTILFPGVSSMFFDDAGDLYMGFGTDHIIRIEGVGVSSVSSAGSRRTRQRIDYSASEDEGSDVVGDAEDSVAASEVSGDRTSAPDSDADGDLHGAADLPEERTSADDTPQVQVYDPALPAKDADPMSALLGLFEWRYPENYQLTNIARENLYRVLSTMREKMAIQALGQFFDRANGFEIKFPEQLEIDNAAELLKLLVISFSDCFTEDQLMRAIAHDVPENTYWWAGYWHLISDLMEQFIGPGYLLWAPIEDLDMLDIIAVFLEDYCDQVEI